MRKSLLLLFLIPLLALTGCNLQALPATFGGITIGLVVGERAPASHNLVVGQKIVQKGKTYTIPWWQTSTAETPDAIPLQRETIAQGLAQHHFMFILFDVPIHETDGSQDFYESLDLQRQFKGKADFIFVDPWQDALFNNSKTINQWQITTSAHHAYYLVDDTGVIRYALVGFFSEGEAAEKIKLLLARKYTTLWNDTYIANRLGQSLQPGVGK